MNPGRGTGFRSRVRRRLAAAAMMAMALAIIGPPTAAGAHGAPPELEIQALIRSATDPLTINYQVTATFADGDPADVTVVFEAANESGDVIERMPTEPTAPGVSILEVRFPDTGLWTVTVEATGDDGTTTVSFTENLPWPHYAAEAGTPKVKVDTVNPEREGTLLAPPVPPSPDDVTDTQPQPADSAPVTAEEDEPARTAPAASAAQSEPPGSTFGEAAVVVNRSIPLSTLRGDVLLRLAHLAALGMWAVPLLGWLFGARSRRLTILSLVGMAATLGTGVLLTIWGAPLESPGLLRWSDLGERVLGTAYQWAFIAKLAATALAATATVLMAWRRTRPAPAIALGGISGAAVAVTIMTQAHLFAHL